MTVTPTRRERLREAAVAEIKQAARRLLAEGGPQAISLRAIAREMGMTAPAIYRYFPSLDALVTALAGDLFDELREAVQAARDDAGDDPLPQILAMSRAFRRWSVAHPVEFGLVFGSPMPGVAALELCRDRDHPGARFGQPFLEAFLELRRRRPFRTPPLDVIREQLGDDLEPLRASHGDLPIDVAWAFLSGWTRLNGMVAMEVNHHLQWALTRPEALFELELSAFAHQLGVVPDADR
ncbi:MAG TPA: TetR/AcrR family transcriptional regulator [Asanoa sp.]